MNHRCRSIVLLVLVIASPAAAVAQGADAKAKSDAAQQKAVVDVVRADIRAHKTALINQTMNFNDAEMKAFWPVYREFEAKQTALDDQRLKLISGYVEAVARMSDKEADAIAAKAIDLESKATSLKRDYYNKLKSALPVKTAVKALAIELR
jgi:hypothetical protein